jgi:hypothetical protein
MRAIRSLRERVIAVTVVVVLLNLLATALLDELGALAWLRQRRQVLPVAAE